MKYVTPKYKEKSFTCSICDVTANQVWSNKISVSWSETQPNNSIKHHNYDVNEISVARCSHCQNHSFWLSDKMIYPMTGAVHLPNEDMPDDIKEDYNEAKSIVNYSPRGAAALLRLVVQKLCTFLGEDGKNINNDIKELVKKGLPQPIQQALDSVRIIGNNAVHPGQIDLKDDYETAYKMFGFINVICETLISQPKKIQEFYDFKVPVPTKEAIVKRDAASK